MKKYILITTLFAILALTFTDGYAQNRRMNRDFDRRDRIADILKLTDEQESMIDDLRYENQSQAIDKRSEMQKNKLEIRKMLDDGNIDESKLLSLVNKNSQIQANLKNERVKMWLDIYNLLDDTQKQIWADHFPRMSEGMHFGNRGLKGARHGKGMGIQKGIGRGMDERLNDRPGRFQN